MRSEKIPLIEIHYLPCIRYMSMLSNFPLALLEQQEHFIKQTYRNRCTIYGANGRLDLIIPLMAGKSRKPLKEAEISYAVNWHHIHWKSIKAAYQSSPYFEYYEDKFEPLFRKKYRYLVDMNLELLQLVMQLMQLPTELKLTETYIEDYSQNEEGQNVIDLRDKIHPRSKFAETDLYSHNSYRQVFQEKCGFLENLSVLDLLFNQGPRSTEYLIKV